MGRCITGPHSIAGQPQDCSSASPSGACKVKSTFVFLDEELGVRESDLSLGFKTLCSLKLQNVHFWD